MDRTYRNNEKNRMLWSRAMTNLYDGLCHDIPFHAAWGLPWRYILSLDPNVHCIKYLRTLEAFRKIGVESKHVHGFWPHFYWRECSHKGQPSLFRFLFLPIISYTESQKKNCHDVVSKSEDYIMTFCGKICVVVASAMFLGKNSASVFLMGPNPWTISIGSDLTRFGDCASLEKIWYT